MPEVALIALPLRDTLEGIRTPPHGRFLEKSNEGGARSLKQMPEGRRRGWSRTFCEKLPQGQLVSLELS
jgi:hypothetical protein